MLFEYPVYVADIKPSGLKVVSLGTDRTSWDENGLAQVPQSVMSQAADQAVALITNPELYRDMVEHNFQVGKTYYSMDALRKYLTDITR
ncbi:MAG: hypothetical protein M5U34_09725 [Chloroflexi bacterium]|nr:hypothetical protein [Chloroflexota bacterium]